MTSDSGHDLILRLFYTKSLSEYTIDSLYALHGWVLERDRQTKKKKMTERERGHPTAGGLL